MRGGWRPVVGLLACVAVTGSGCAPPPPDGPAPAAIAPQTREALSLRAVSGLTRGLLAKPAGAFENDPAFALAPLLIVAVPEGDEAAVRLPVGVPERLPAGILVDPERPTVFTSRSTTTIAGRTHERRSYVWWPAGRPVDGEGAGSGPQGVRMTLDPDGSPFLWEVLRDSSGARLLFVDRALEEAASAELGPPLPGREYSVERSFEEAPSVVVARVIESGATPLGPFVYVGEVHGDVHTVLCRCMDSEVGEIVGLDEYRLQSIDSQRSLDLEVAWDPASPEAWLRFPAGWPADE